MTPLEAFQWVSDEILASVADQGLEVREIHGARGSLHYNQPPSADPPVIYGSVHVTKRRAGFDPPVPWDHGLGPGALWTCDLDFEMDSTPSVRMGGRRQWKWNVSGQDGSARLFMDQGWRRGGDLALDRAADRMSDDLQSCVRQGRRWAGGGR